MIHLIIRPAAEADYRRAMMWYDGEEPGLGDKFFEDLRNTMARIRGMPLQFPDIGGAHRALFHTFPYAIYFILPKPDRGVVLAIVHQHRQPSIWRRRLRSRGRNST
jgi:toxin ParE1/3/4